MRNFQTSLIFRLSLFFSFIFLFISCAKEKTVSLKSLLMDMINREELTRFPEPYYKLKQFSSYDRKSVRPDEDGWFANADYTQFIGIDSLKGRKEYIMFDTDGPGAITRWWMTFAGEGSYDGTIRLYIDNLEKPVVEDNVLKVISGQLLAGEPLSASVSPLTDSHQRGHNLYLPVPFSKHCKITYECSAIKITPSSRRPSIYYNICYREYEKNTKVISFNMNELKNAGELIRDVNKSLLSPTVKDDKTFKIWKISGELNRTDTMTISPNSGASAISRLSVRISAGNMPQAMRSTVLKMTFDGLNTVWVPAGEFFGTGYKKTESSTWESNVSESGLMEAYWLMPYRRSAVIQLINYGYQPVISEIKVETSDYKWDKRSMYFGASWHEYYNIKTAGAESVGGTGKHYDINFAEIEGKGLYAGDAITVFNTADAWFGEGDEKIFVDGESFPSSIGTGTEDYYGYAWCRPELFSHPFIAQPSGSGNFNPGQTINMRYRDLDAIPLRTSISSNIELWHWAPTVINYALTSYWYISPPYKTNIEPKPGSVRNPVALKRADIIKPQANEDDIIEGENLDVLGKDGGTVETQFITSLDWSNKGQLWWYGGQPGNKLNLRFIVSESGTYDITGRLSRAVDYGIIGFEINGNPLNKSFNGYIPENVEATEVNFGNFHLRRGDNILTLIIKGKDKNAKPGFMAGIDYIKLIKVW